MGARLTYPRGYGIRALQLAQRTVHAALRGGPLQDYKNLERGENVSLSSDIVESLDQVEEHRVFSPWLWIVEKLCEVYSTSPTGIL